jgi:ketol-acid reductoisomerase
MKAPDIVGTQIRNKYFLDFLGSVDIIIAASFEAEGSGASLAQAIFDCLGALARTQTQRSNA